MSPRGLLTPLGAHKGAGLALMIDVLAGVLTGSGFGTGVKSIYGAAEPNRAGHMLIALEVERFLPRTEYEERLRSLLDTVRGTPRFPGVERIYVPGEPEAELRARRRADGIPVPPAVVESLGKLAARLGTDPLETR
jgi:LDH2 family malate/lactate/ureidoglycolate dehydrogenase